MNSYQVISLLFGSGVLVGIGKYFINRLKETESKNEAICLGVQALLRDRLLSTYNKYIEKGYAPHYAKENFENMWKQYHNLGENGVMDDKHEEFKNLPDRRPDYEHQNRYDHPYNSPFCDDCK